MTSYTCIRVSNEEYSSFESKYLHQKIGFILQSIRFNIDDKHIYHNSYQLHSYLRKISEDDIYSIQHKKWLISLTQFLEFSKNFIDFEEFYIEEEEYEETHKYINVDIWITGIDNLIQSLNYIIDSFNYNYQDMKKKGEAFYCELSEYVYNPERIERVSKKYNMEWDTYLDCLDL